MTSNTEREPRLSSASRPHTTTLEVTRAIDIAADPRPVFDYVSDFRRAHEWRTEVMESTMQPHGPMRAGSRLREVAVIAGRRVITDSVVGVFEPPHRFTFEHVSGPLPVNGEYSVNSRLGQTRTEAATLRYTLRVQLRGAWRLLTPLLKLTAPRTVDKSLRTLATRVTTGAP